jgi:polyferredoxin
MATSDLINIQPSNGGKPAKRTRQPWYMSPKVLRHAVMIFFFVFLAHVAIDHQIKGGGPRGTPSVEAYCPFGGLETLYQFLTTGGFVRRIEASSVVLFFALVILTLVASRGFCGWICPFGSVQEWIGMLGKKIFRKRFNPAGKVDSVLRYLKYVVLAVIIALTWHTGSLVFRDYDPFLAFFHFGEGIDELPWAYSILLVVLIGSLYIERFFCKYACPLGAVLGILGKLGFTKIQRDAEGCKECNICYQKCHAHVDFLSGTSIRSAECNQCMDCTVDCPKPAVLTMRGWKWRFSHPVFAAILVVGLFGLVLVSQAAGKWQTKPNMASFTNAAGKLDAQQIRGWMTLNDISSGYQIPLNDLYAAAGLPSRVSANTRINRIKAEHKVEFEPEKVRDLVDHILLGKPASEFTAKAKPVVEKAASAAAPGQPQTQAKAEHKPGNPQGAGKKDGKKDGKKGGEEGEEPEVKGFMTLNEVALKTGVPKAYMLQELGLKEADVDGRSPLREWMHAKGKSVAELRDIVTKYRKTQGK